MDFDFSELSTGELDALLQATIAERAKRGQREPGNPPDYIMGSRDPKWFCDRIASSVLVRVHDYTIGWLAFEFPPHEAAALGSFLSKFAVQTATTAPVITILGKDPDA